MAVSHEVSDCDRLDIAVLVVDDDATTLSVNAAFLRSWDYKVATATSDHEALETLREFRGFFDLVITDLNIRGMNGFELQKRVKSEFHLPVIIMSEDGRKSVMSRSLEQGAAFCLVKPVRREDLRDVWQYAVAGRREKLRVENGRIVSVRGEEEEEGDSSSSPAINIASAQDSTSPKKQRKKSCKRKRSDDEMVDNEELIFCGPKRSKIFWTVNLHSRFLLALRHLGMDKAVPTKILEIMNVPGLTRENVASHLQKYRLFLKRIAEKGILEGLPERALRSRFAMGLPTDLIRDIQKRLTRFHEISYYHQPYSTYRNPQIPQNPPTTRPFLANQTRLAPPNYHGGTNHTYGNFQQPHYHNLHRPIVDGGGFMTSANNGLTSNYSNPSLVVNNRSFNYGPNNYYYNNNNHGMLVPYGSSGLQPSPGTYYNNHHGTQLMNNNNNRGMTVPYGSHGFQPNPSTYYNNHYGTQLNNNNASLTVDALNVQNVRYTVHNRNGSASNNAVVPVSSSSVANVGVDEPTRANISASLNPSFPHQQSINGIRNAATSVNQWEVGQMDDLNELFLMLDDVVSLDKTVESPRAGERSISDLLSSFNVEDYIELLQGDGDHVNAQTRERSISVLPNKSSSSCPNENPNMVMRNDLSTNLGRLNMFVEEKANSPSANSTPREQDWDMDLIETLFFDAADPSLK